MNKFAQYIEAYWYRERHRYLSLVFCPLSYLFALIVCLRRYFYRYGILKAVRLPVTLVVVGNIHVGGTGKTPITATLVGELVQKGKKVGIVSRGYGAQVTEAILVDRTQSACLYGDEPFLLAWQTKVPVAVGSDRVKAAELLLRQYPDLDIIVSDDGLQHYRLARDYEVIVFPELDIGKRLHLMPWGPLREPMSRLNHASALVLNQTTQSKTDIQQASDKDVFESARYRLNLSVDVLLLRSSLQHKGMLYALNKPSEVKPISYFQDKAPCALCGIGRPERFFMTLREAGLELSQTIALADHASLSPSVLPDGAEYVIVTEKDAVKLREFDLPQVWVLPVYAIIRPDASGLFES